MDQVLTEVSPDAALPDQPQATHEPPISQVRPRVRQDVVFAQTSDGAFLRHAESGFVMKGRTAYQWIAALLPHFTGENTVAELCGGLNREQQDLIGSIVSTLLERGFVRDFTAGRGDGLLAAVAGRYQSQIDFVDHYVGDAITRFARFRASRVLVAGAVPASVAAAESLLRNGLEQVDIQLDPRSADADLARLTGETRAATQAGAPASVNQVHEYLPALSVQQLGRYQAIIVFADQGKAADAIDLARRLPDGPAILPVTVVGHRVVLGPLTRAGAAPCWICLLLRLGANIPATEMADLWRGASLPQLLVPGGLGQDVSARMIGNAAAFDMFRWLTGTLGAETDHAVVVQDLETLDTVRERLLPHPLCPSCHPYQDGGMRETAADLTGEQQLQRLLRLVASHVGVFSGFDDGQIDQSPLKVSRIRLGPADFAARTGRTITAFDVNTAADARRRVLYQAMQVYLAQVADPAQGIPAPPAGPRVVHPESLLTYSGMTPVEPLRRWLAATSFITGELCYVPAEAVHLSGRGNVGGCFEVTSAGRGTGLDHDGAVVAGLGSALAYYALRRTLAGHPACPLELPPAVAADSPAGFLVRAAGHFGLEPRLYLLPGVPGFPVVVAVSEARAPGAQDHLLWSAGWGADALLDALRDLVGQRQLLETGAAADLGDALLTEFHPGSLRVEAGTQPVRFEASRYAATRETLGDSLVAAGLDALVAEVTTADLRGTGVVHAVRVLLAEASWSG